MSLLFYKRLVGDNMHAKWALFRRTLVVLATPLLAAACSTADYSKPVNDFAAATAESKTALALLDEQVTEAYGEILENGVAGGKVFLRVKSGDCNVTSDRCRLVVVDRGEKEEPYPPEPPLTRMTLLMGGINSYAANLKALIEADTARQVETQVNAALGSIKNLAGTITKLRPGAEAPPTTVPQFATPVGAAVNWIVGQYVEHVKFKGLQQATANAKPVVRQAADLFRDVSSFASDVPKAELANEVSAATDAVRTDRSKLNITKFAHSAAKYDALLTSSPPSLFGQLGEAHDALAESLESDGLTLATATARIEAFAAEVQKLAKTLKDIRAINSDK